MPVPALVPLTHNTARDKGSKKKKKHQTVPPQSHESIWKGPSAAVCH